MSKFATAVTFITLCAAIGVSEANAEGLLSGKKDRKKKIEEVMLARKTPLQQFEANAATGRGARHSCIADFQALCLDDGGKLMKKDKIEAEAQKAADAKDDNGNGAEGAAAARGFAAQAAAGSDSLSKVARGRKQRLALRGMERCLSTRIDEISDETCKSFIVGRNKCFSEAETVCASKADDADKKEEAAANAPKSVADAIVDEKTVKKELKKDKDLSVSVANVALTQKLTAAQLAEVRADYARVQCLRKSEQSKFSESCTGSSFFNSVILRKGKRAGIRAKIADKIMGKKKSE